MGERIGLYRILVWKPEVKRHLGRPRGRWEDNMGEGRGLYRFLVGKPEGKRHLGRPRVRWEDNMWEKRLIQDFGWEI
jgi:hypothetical protein